MRGTPFAASTRSRRAYAAMIARRGSASARRSSSAVVEHDRRAPPRARRPALATAVARRSATTYATIASCGEPDDDERSGSTRRSARTVDGCPACSEGRSRCGWTGNSRRRSGLLRCRRLPVAEPPVRETRRSRTEQQERRDPMRGYRPSRHLARDRLPLREPVEESTAAATTTSTSPRLKSVSRSVSAGGRVRSLPPGVEPVDAIATTPTSTSTTSAVRSTLVAATAPRAHVEPTRSVPPACRAGSRGGLRLPVPVQRALDLDEPDERPDDRQEEPESRPAREGCRRGRPAWYIFPTSDGTRNHVTTPTTM